MALFLLQLFPLKKKHATFIHQHNITILPSNKLIKLVPYNCEGLLYVYKPQKGAWSPILLVTGKFLTSN